MTASVELCLRAMNQIGVKLLEQGCYGQATLTFQEAIAVLKSNLPSRTKPPTPEPLSPKTHLERASARLLTPQKQKVFSAVDIETLRLHDTRPLKGFIDNKSYHGFSRLHPIHFADDCCNTVEQRDCDVESVVLLHNLAISHLCLSNVLGANALTAASLRTKALKVFGLAHSILSSQRSGCDDVFRLVTLLQLELVVLTDSLVLTGETHQGEEVRSLLCCLTEMLEDIFAADHIFDIRYRPAPAA